MIGQFNVLLIEDNPADAILIDIYLREAYDKNLYTLTTAVDLKTGLDFAVLQEFDVILVDLLLPDSFGLETFKKVFDVAFDTPIIVLTGVDDEKIGLNSMKLGAQDFLIKGKVKSKGLRRSINYSIERNNLHKELSDKNLKLQEKTEDLVKEKRKLSDAQRFAHIGSWEWNIKSDTFNLSDELCKIYGIDADKNDLTLELFFEHVHPEDKNITKKIIEESYQLKIPFSFFHRIIHPKKEVRIIHVRGDIVKNESGIPLIMLGTGQDVTEQKHEAELEKLAMAATKSFNSVIIANDKGEIEWVNEGFTKLSGYSIVDLKNIGKSLFEFITISKFSEMPASYEREYLTKDGVKYWAITTLSPMFGEDGEIARIIAIDTDITLRKQVEEDLINANKKLEELMKVKEQFLANMSHEIRTPMNAIIGFTELLLKTKLSEEQSQCVDAIKSSGKNLIVIINDILDFSKIQSGKVTLEKIEFNLTHLIAKHSQLIQNKALNKEIRVSSSVSESIPPIMVGDPTRLNQIILNLVSNAVKFTEKGEVKILVELLDEDNNMLELKFSVSDTGIGIPEDKQQSIFDGFTQANNETTRKYGGTGLGLTIVKQLVELQEGSIQVESTVGIGSKFIFKMKFLKSHEINGAKNDFQPEVLDLSSTETLSVLLVEDNSLNQLLAEKIITNWNWKVEIVGNGLLALDKLKDNDYDIILMDIQLPEMDGYEATKRIRNTFPAPKCNIPIIAMTAHAITGEDLKCKNAGMDDYISKPFEEKVLYQTMISVYNKQTLKITETI